MKSKKLYVSMLILVIAFLFFMYITLYFTNNITFITSLLMTLESYLWLVLMYIIFNIKIVKKGEK